jgi:hypothetical protein
MMKKLFDRFFGKKEKAPEPVQAPPEVKKPKAPVKSEKDLATERGEPYVNILSLELDPADMGQGAFELDWNEKFISNLIRAGYQMKPTDSDSDIIDRWFQNVCRNVVLETWEQEQANNPQRDRVVKSRDIGDGRSEVS